MDYTEVKGVLYDSTFMKRLPACRIDAEGLDFASETIPETFSIAGTLDYDYAVEKKFTLPLKKYDPKQDDATWDDAPPQTADTGAEAAESTA